MMNIFSVALLFLSLIYAAFICWCFVGWRKLQIHQQSSGDFKTFVSVIVPARNEEKNIEDCLNDILNQNYPKEFFEIIVVDDHSTDRTSEIISDFILKFPKHKISLLNNESKTGTLYKKQAITTAVEKANGELIITTDADCRMLVNWISAFVSYYEKEKPFMISAPVCFCHEKNAFEKFQSIEFSGLIGIGAGSISNRQPIMCNGANLAYTKKIFQEVNGFTDESQTASGDDTQLMLKIAKINSSKINFLKSHDAVVYTSAMSSVKDLFHQRKRWASKIPTKMNAATLFFSFIAYFLHLGLLVLLIASMFNHSILLIFLLIFLLKIIPEFIFLLDVNSFFRKKNLLWLFLPAQIVYMVYISFIGAVAPFGSYQWKERKIKTQAKKFSVS